MATTNNAPHPLTETIAEVTEEMRRAAASAYEDMAQVTRPENHEKCLNAALSAALAVATPADPRHDPRPWEPLNGVPVRVGDEVRQEYNGVTVIAVVGHVDADGDLWTAEGRFIGVLEYGTWYVRRPVQDVPTEPGTVLEPADGHEYITATTAGQTYRAREAILIGDNQWHAAWRSDEGVLPYVTPERIDPDTWKKGTR